MNELLAVVVEDDPSLCTIFSEAVRRGGFTVESFHEGRAALQRLRQVQPRLLVLDLHLPDISGTELLYPLRSDPRLSEMIIILATADPLLAGLYNEQADFVLLKPISYVQLRDLAARIGGVKTE